MKNRHIILLLLFLLVASCGRNNMMPDLEHIKRIGDKDPKLALCMFDSLSVDVKGYSTYCQMKYELLKIRLQDKNDVAPVSNKMVEHLLQYFAGHGTQADKQEAYYYAGSVYRDLQDVPRSLEKFLKSVEMANGECDSIMLRNAYSNLSYLFYYVQDYRNALEMARNEYKVAGETHSMTINVIMHLGNAYLSCGKAKYAMKYFDEALAMIVGRKCTDIFPFIYVLLYQYSEFEDINKAKKCLGIIRSVKNSGDDDFANNALAKYYEAMGMPDSSIVYYKRIMDNASDERNMYDASKALFHIYLKKNNMGEACIYGEKFVRLTEELDLGKKQELAATVNNKYKYNLDRGLVQRTEQERVLYLRAVVGLVAFVLLLVLVMAVLYTRKKNAMLRKQLAAANKLNDMRMHHEVMQEELADKARQLHGVKAELESNGLQLQQANADIDRYATELQVAQQELADKRRHVQSLVRMLHRTEFASNAEDVVLKVREAARGKRKLKPGDWHQLYDAVDTLWPDFRDMLVERLGDVTEHQRQACYLMRIGMNNPQINTLADMPRTTIWRWTKAQAWIYALPRT